MDNFVKMVDGYVQQYYERDKDGTFVCTSQYFIAGDVVRYEDDGGEVIKSPDYEYYPYEMIGG